MRTLLLSAVLLAGCATSTPDTTFVVPVTPMFGADAVVCGTTFEGAGTSAASFDLRDFGMYVHDVVLIREGGEEVPAHLVVDGIWQDVGVARLDFTDGSGLCAGDDAMNAELVLHAPPHDDYAGLTFGLGVPEELNHLDATKAQAPLNAPSTWWSWKGGYLFFQMTLATDVNEKFYVHVGSTSCDGDPESGFDCAASHATTIDVPGFTPGEDGLAINVAALLSEVDLDATPNPAEGDFIAGCMSFEGDPECDALYTKFGRHFMSEDPAPAQVVFEVDAGAGAIVDADDAKGTPQPGDPAFERDPALDEVENISAHGLDLSHPVGAIWPIGDQTHDRGPGSQCMKCHQALGPGRGQFTIAGTVWQPEFDEGYGEGALVHILPVYAAPCGWGDERAHCEGQPIGYYRPEDVVAELEVDANGNFYTTELLEGAEPPFWPVVVPAETDEHGVAKAMGHPAGNGSCNMCHGNIPITLQAESH